MEYASFSARYRSEIVKESGTHYTKWITFSISKYLTYAGHVLGVSPNVVTILSAVTVAAGVATLVAIDDRLVGGIAALLLLQLGYAFDWSDGQLARLDGKASNFGGFLDLVVDRFNNQIVFAGIIGGELLRSGEVATRPIAFLLVGLLGYCSYTVTSMLRGLFFPSTKGFSKSASGVTGVLAKAAHEFGDTGLHFLLLSIGYIAGIAEYVALAYGVWGLLMNLLTVALVRRIDTKNSGA